MRWALLLFSFSRVLAIALPAKRYSVRALGAIDGAVDSLKLTKLLSVMAGCCVR